MVLAGCSAAHYKKSADKEVYEIIRKKQMAALGIDGSFSIEREHADPLLGLPFVEPAPLADIKAGPTIALSLPQALEIAAKNSRDYQSQEESVYLEALDLTLARYRWGPIFGGSASAEYEKTDGDETVGGGIGLGLSKLFADGTSLGVDLSTDLLMHLVQNPREAAASLITVTLTRPLWRGASKRIAQENLLQSERDIVYTIRSFARFRKTFAVSIATQYYRVLQQRDSVLNAWSNYQNVILVRERTEMMARAGRLPEFEVDQAQQDELSAKDGYVQSVQSYYQSLDQFKIELGLPTDASVVLDPNELALLRERGIIHPDVSTEQAVELALEARLDLASDRDRVADYGRKVVVAKNGLSPDVDLVLTASAPTANNQPGNFRTDFGTYTAGLDVDLPIERRTERNTYRRALISLESGKRDATLKEDRVKLDVRDAWRGLQEARAGYEIQDISLTLAMRRVESTTLLLQAGRASTRDLLESQAALLRAQNALTRTLIDHTLARLQFWRDIGILEVNENGLWKEDYDFGAE
jgi:outer membrane protein TolC